MQNRDPVLSDFFRDIVNEMKDEDTTIAADGKGSGEFTGYIDSGCMMLNAIVSGSLVGGMPNNKVLVLAGESSTGKTYIALGIVRHFLNPTKMMVDRGIDPRRVIRSEPATLQDFRTKAIKILEKYKANAARPPMLLVLDSLGMLSSEKEMADTSEGKDTRDMTKAQLIRGIFRVLRLRMAKLQVPMIVTGHTYASVGAYVPTQVLSGGGGVVYASDNIVFLRKSKDKEGTEVVGNILKARMHKSRGSRENREVEMRLSYDTGLDRYFGLLELGERHGVVKRVGNRYQFPDGQLHFRKHIDADPESVYTETVLAELEKAANREFQYGNTITETVDPTTGEFVEG
jgi:RecA/RadA recombinase